AEGIITATLAIAVSTDVALTVAQFKAAREYRFTDDGVGAGWTLTVPSEWSASVPAARDFIVRNDTGQTCTVVCSTPASPEVTVDVADGDIVQLRSDGTDIYLVGGTGGGGGLADVVDDTTPQLGGPLDTNSHQIRWSKGADVASASTLTLGADGNFFDITGTTTVAAIATVGVGTLVGLQFDGILTLTHHATDLVLPGGADITTAAGDIATFCEYTTGDWRCISYQRAGVAPYSGAAGVPITDSADWFAGSDVETGLSELAATLRGRNRLINGDFLVWQLGTSLTTVADDSYTADGWILLSNHSTTGPTVGQDSDGSLQVTIKEANSQVALVQLIEAANVRDIVGAVASTALDIKASGLTDFDLEILAWDSTADAMTSDVIGTWQSGATQITPATNWTSEGKADITATGSFLRHKLENVSVDTASAVNVAILLVLKDSDAAVDDTINVRRAQLEAAAKATPFEYRLKPIDLFLCQRYFEVISSESNGYAGFGVAQAASTSRAVLGLVWKVQKRTPPTITFSAYSDWSFYNATINTYVVWSSGSAQTTEWGGILDITTATSGLAGGGTATMATSNAATTAARIYVDSRL
ncbi:MAG: hypothetical protein KDE45_25450, partial [Caldilineaceae bacterium]|nr:hypothetical protein [Caldilineaceae bacterium]